MELHYNFTVYTIQYNYYSECTEKNSKTTYKKNIEKMKFLMLHPFSENHHYENAGLSLWLKINMMVEWTSQATRT